MTRRNTDEGPPDMTSPPGHLGGCANKFIAAVDVGTSVLRCHIYDSRAQVCGSASDKVELLNPSSRTFEMDPEKLWQSFVTTVKAAIQNAGLAPQEVSALGICTQRGTFTTWNRKTGKVYHNLITWKDVRAENLCREWNCSYRLMCLKAAARALYLMTGSKRFLAVSLLRYQTGLVAMRLLWALSNFSELRRDADAGKAVMGTLDTFLLWRLTAGQVHATEPSCACITGFYDLFQMEWSPVTMKMLNVPLKMLPVVRDTSCTFGHTEPSIFGASIPIAALAGDQQASAFGECCFELGDSKCTMGTGTFFNVNTGREAHSSVTGIYPVVGWRINNVVTYLAEGSSYDTGTIIDWAHRAGLYKNVNDSSGMALSVSSSEGLFFVPAFSGLQAPMNDAYATSGFLGVSPRIRKEHFVRAVLESLAFRTKQVYDILTQELQLRVKRIRFNGGVANNEFVIQLLADLLQQPISRSQHRDTSCLGAAFLAGLAIGVWKDTAELKKLRQGCAMYETRKEQYAVYQPVYEEWQRAVGRFLQWHNGK
ncbi:putative glycerol kinase 5 isoform X2 [Ornithodoros turicata]|uniref:putative glycerol kinase 5 isoform X2 n=1 Tax=Ornithodoros turicata TaxID=34597 RepID=UPI00313988EE